MLFRQGRASVAQGVNVLIFVMTTSLALFSSSVVNAKPNDSVEPLDLPLALQVIPERCIALHRGQTCYLEVVFTWELPEVDDYCLINTTTNKLLRCWKQQNQGQYMLDFQSSQSNSFSLITRSASMEVGATKIEVAWVYNSTKRAKSRWRLF